MKRMILFSLMALMTIAAFGRKHVENATVVADTILLCRKYEQCNQCRIRLVITDC